METGWPELTSLIWIVKVGKLVALSATGILDICHSMHLESVSLHER